MLAAVESVNTDPLSRTSRYLLRTASGVDDGNGLGSGVACEDDCQRSLDRQPASTRPARANHPTTNQ